MKTNLLKALATVSSMTLLSRVLGFIRDFIIARTFGAGDATDAFFVAFRLPNLLRRLFAEGAFSQAFVPVLAEYRQKNSAAETQTLINRVASALTLVVLLVTLAGIIAAPAIIYLSAPGFSDDSEKFALTVTLTRITFPYILFMALVALCGGILNTWSRFSIPAFTPVLLNISFIGMALFAAPWFSPPILALAWAVFIGGILQLLLQIRPLQKLGLLPRPSLHMSDPGVKRILTLMLPALLGVSVAQLSLLLNTVFASFLPEGSVSWLYYADRLMEFPSGLLGAALGTILLPSLSRLYADHKNDDFSALLDWGIRLTLLLTLPAAVGLGLLAIPLISTLFQYGAFSANDVLETQTALTAYSIGLSGLILVRILAPAFYARQNIRTPVKFALISLLTTQVLNAILIQHFAHVGLALSISLAALLNAFLLFLSLKRARIYQPQPGWRMFALRIVVALCLLTAFLLWATPANAHWIMKMAFSERIVTLSILIGAAILIYFAALFAMGFRIKDFRRNTV